MKARDFLLKSALFLGFLYCAIVPSGVANDSVKIPDNNTYEQFDCNKIIKKVEAEYKIPKNLLLAIAKIESKTNPWAIHARGKSYFFNSHEKVASFIKEQKKKGTKNIFVGCMQICLKTHGKAFDSIEDATDPHQNIRYAAKLLRNLYERHGCWEKAIMYYNSSKKKTAYKNKVLRAWGKSSQMVQLINQNKETV